MKKKIEMNILILVLIEAFYLLFIFKESLFNILLGTILGLILIVVCKKVSKNKLLAFFLLIISIIFLIISLFRITSFISFNLLRNYSSLIIFISFLILSLYISVFSFYIYIYLLII